MQSTGIEVYMRLDGKMVDILCKLNQSYNEFRVNSEKGDYIVVNLDRALYGCVESAKLWYDDLKSTLNKAGYEPNPMDECVFNKGVGDKQCTIALHVDDMLITSANENMIVELIDKLKKRYTEGVTVHDGPVVSYLGMTLNWSKRGEVSVTQEGYIMDMLRDSGVEGTSKTPAADNLYETREETPLASKDVSEWFHSQVAKALYLAKRNQARVSNSGSLSINKSTKM